MQPVEDEICPAVTQNGLLLLILLSLHLLQNDGNALIRLKREYELQNEYHRKGWPISRFTCLSG